ncbi:hypothetical protein JCM10296v2_007333 [Rhodotorula toruloides]
MDVDKLDAQVQAHAQVQAQAQAPAQMQKQAGQEEDVKMDGLGGEAEQAAEAPPATSPLRTGYRSGAPSPPDSPLPVKLEFIEPDPFTGHFPFPSSAPAALAYRAEPVRSRASTLGGQDLRLKTPTTSEPGQDAFTTPTFNNEAGSLDEATGGTEVDGMERSKSVIRSLPNAKPDTPLVERLVERGKQVSTGGNTRPALTLTLVTMR